MGQYLILMEDLCINYTTFFFFKYHTPIIINNVELTIPEVVVDVKERPSKKN